MSEKRYMIEYAIWNAVWYFIYISCLNLNLVVPGLTLGQSKWLLLVLTVVCGTVGICRTIDRERNYFSLFLSIFVSYGIYNTIAFTGRYPVLFLVSLVLVLCAVLVYAILIFRQPVRSTRRRKRILSGRRKKVMSVGRLVFCFLSVICLGVIVVDANYHRPMIKANVEATQKRQLTREMVLEVAEEVLLLREDAWGELSLQEKVDVLQIVANMEQAYLGIPHAVMVQAGEIEGTTNGYYIDVFQTIVINAELLKEKSSWEAVDVICHEMYHAYQYRLVETFDEVAEKNRNLRLFHEVVSYKNEFENYESGRENYLEYYTQQCEKDARAYAGDRAVLYYKLVSDFLNQIAENLKNASQ